MMGAKIFIPKPCHENWENMSPDEKGKFCSVCSKSVYDFTNKSKAEIIETIDLEKANICGRFSNYQIDIPQNFLQRKVLQINQFTLDNLQKYSFVIFLVSLLLTITGCKKKITGDIVINSNEESTSCNSDKTKTPPIMGESIIVENTAQIKKKTDSIRNNKLK